MRKLTIFIMCMVFAFNVMAQNTSITDEKKKDFFQIKVNQLLKIKQELQDEIIKVNSAIAMYQSNISAIDNK